MIRPVRLGAILLAVYLAVLAAIAIFIHTPAGTCPLLFSVTALPWSLFGHWLYGGGYGLHVGTLVGLVLNGAGAFALGYWLARRPPARR